MNLIRRRSSVVPSFSMLDDIFRNDWLDHSKKSFSEFSLPAVNIKELEGTYKIELAVPGMEKNNFKIEVENDLLTVSSELENKVENKEENYTRKEFHFQSFSRSFNLPKNIDGEGIAASYKDGILSITVPKLEEAKLKSSKVINVA